MKKAFAIIIVLALLSMNFVAFAEDEVNYINSEEYLVVGTNDYALSADYEYTVFALEPTETGKYFIASENALLGIVSNNGMWITTDPTAETVNLNVIEWDCTAVGQSIWVAAKGEGETVTITVSDEELVIVVTPKEEYVNKANLSAFTYEGDADALVYVDTEDDVVEQAVLGEDGFYHLNAATGPVLYVDLDDPLMNLEDAMGYGQLKSAVYEEDTLVKIIDYNAAFGQYLNVADPETLLYPLTEDLIAIYKGVGEYQGWYGEDGWVGGTKEDAWMFACYYDENYVDPSQIKLGDINADGEIDKFDYILVKRAVMETYVLNEAEKKAADINGVDGVDVYDYILVKRHVMGTYTIGE